MDDLRAGPEAAEKSDRMQRRVGQIKRDRVLRPDASPQKGRRHGVGRPAERGVTDRLITKVECGAFAVIGDGLRE